MMNRGVMDRQMFAKGGAAFPDMSGDGKITQKDILMGRGVEFKQEGGIAGMMPQEMPPVAPAMAAGQAAMMPDPGAPIQQAAGAVDPAVIEQALAGVSQDIGNLENMDNLEDMMNAIRGDDATVEQRYDELAGVVGEEDAAKTPESVLALVQPVMMLNAVDQGIGALAQEEMTQEVTGPMAEGIMSTVAQPPAPEPAPVPMEGPPPVNFKDGGLVRRGDNQPVIMMNAGGDPLQPFYGPRVDITPAESATLRQNIDNANLVNQLNEANAKLGAAPSVTPLSELFEDRKAAYRELLGDSSADLEKQKNLTQAQMLFDIANTALTFAAPMQGERAGMSPAERLAMAATTTKLPQTIGARAQAQLEAEQAAAKEGRALDLAALQAAEKTRETEQATRSAYLQKEMELRNKTFTLSPGEIVYGRDGTEIARGEGQSFTLGVNQVRTNAAGEIIAKGPQEPKTHVLSKGQVLVGSDGKEIAKGNNETFTLSPGQVVKDTTGAIIAKGPAKEYTLSEGQVVVDANGKQVAAGAGKTYVLQPGSVVMDASGKEVAKGPPKTFTLSAGQKIVDANGKEVAKGDGKTFTLSPGQVVVNEKGEEVAKGPVKTAKLGAGDALVDTETGKTIVERAEKPVLKAVNGQLVLFDPATKTSEAVFGEAEPPTFKGVRITNTKTGVSTVVNGNSPAGVKAIEKANNDNAANPGTVNVVNLGTEARPRPKAFLIPGTGVVTSYDGGQTYTTAEGTTEQMPQGPGAAFPLSDTISYDIYRKESIREGARERLAAADDAMTTSLTRPDGSIAPATDQSTVRNAMAAARNATGPWANFSALLDGVVAGTIPSETVRNVFQDTQDNRQFVRALKILGSSALSVSPRMAVYDLARVERLFPDPDAFFRNPISEANKLVVLKQIAIQQRTRNDQALADGIDDATLQSEIIRKNFEIDRLLSLLEGVDASGGGVNSDLQNQILQDIMNKRGG